MSGTLIEAVDDGERRLTAVQFRGLANMPASVEWFANIDNPQTRRAYQSDLRDCCALLGIHQPDDFRQVTRAHVLAWRQHLEQRGLAGATIRRKLAALASLFDYLLESNAIAGGKPVHGVKRPKGNGNEGSTPALGDHQAQQLLDSPDSASVTGRSWRCCSTRACAVRKPPPCRSANCRSVAVSATCAWSVRALCTAAPGGG